MTVGATNKCNIVELVNGLVAQMQWGIATDEAEMLENYIMYLGCGETIPCYPDDCSNPTIHVTCSLTTTGITVKVLTGNQVQFTALFSNASTVTTSFKWTYNTAIFTP